MCRTDCDSLHAIVRGLNNYHNNDVVTYQKQICNENISTLSANAFPCQETPYSHKTPSFDKKRSPENQLMTCQTPPFSEDMQLLQAPAQNGIIQRPQLKSYVLSRPAKQRRLMHPQLNSVVSNSAFPYQMPVYGNHGIGVPLFNNSGLSTLRGSTIRPTYLNNAQNFPSASGGGAVPNLGLSSINNKIQSAYAQMKSRTKTSLQNDSVTEMHAMQLPMEKRIESTVESWYQNVGSEFEENTSQWLEKSAQENAELKQENSELKQRLNEMDADNRQLFAIAKQNELMVTKLQNQNEGMGETDDAQSTCQDDGPISQFACRACLKANFTRVVMPCRHIICDECDALVSACPKCDILKSMSIPIRF